MQKQYNPHFPTGKIKKIIQNNQEVGKLANTIPHLMEHSLQIFLNEILENVNEIASEEDYSKITPALLKTSLKKCGKYDFILPFLNEIEEEELPKRKRNEQDSNNKGRKKRKGNDEE